MTYHSLPWRTLSISLFLLCVASVPLCLCGSLTAHPDARLGRDLPDTVRAKKKPLERLAIAGENA